MLVCLTVNDAHLFDERSFCNAALPACFSLWAGLSLALRPAKGENRKIKSKAAASEAETLQGGVPGSRSGSGATRC
jgi:hypothetical protein